MQKTLKIQPVAAGFLLYTNSSGKVQKLSKATLKEVIAFTEEFLADTQEKKEP